MADIINEIVSQEALTQVDNLQKKLSTLVTQFDQAYESSTKLSGAFKGANANNDAIPKATKALSEQEKIQRSLVRELEKTATEYKKVANEVSNLKAANRASVRETKNVTGVYNEMQQKLSRMTRLYKEMGAARLKDQKFMKAYTDEMQRLHKGLSSMDKAYGKTSRNVGNYRNETFQLSQVIREVPAFTYSAQTGIMALSNNLPMLMDGFQSVAKQVGSSTKALGIFAKSIFSLPNLFAIAVGLFTIFSKEIVEFGKAVVASMSNLTSAERDVKSFNEALNSTIEKTTETKMSVEKVGKAFQLAASGIITETEALRVYNELMGNSLGTAKSFNQAKEQFIKNSPLVIDAIQKEAIAEYYATKIKENAVELQKEQNNEEAWYSKILRASILTMTGINYKSITMNNLLKQSVDLRRQYNKALFESLVAEDKLNEVKIPDALKPKKTPKGKAKGKSKEELYSEQLRKEYEIAKQIGIEGNSELLKIAETLLESEQLIGDDRIKIMSEVVRLKGKLIEDEIKLDEERIKKAIELSKSLAKEFEYAKSSGVANLREQLTIAQTLLENEDLIGEERIKIASHIEKIKQELREQGERKAEIQSEKELAKAKKRLEDLKAVTEAYFEGAKDVGGIIFDKQLLRIDEEKRAIQDKYDLEAELIKANFDTIEQRDKDLARLETQRLLEQQQKDREALAVKQRQARFNKALDSAAIITKTALAIMTALAVNNPAQAIAAGITGAAQLAKVLATPIPQYAEGTQDHTGGHAIVGEKGRELVIEPSGKSYLTPDGDTLMDLPKHTKVIPNHELMNYMYSAPKMPRYNSTVSNAEMINLKELRGDVQELTGVMKRKNLSVNLYGDANFAIYQKSKIR